jgi:excisionase family DNA binding protein
MSASTSENPPHLDARPRYGPTPAAAGSGGGQRPPAATTSGEKHPCPHRDPGQVPARPPKPAPCAPKEPQPASSDPLARLPEVLTAHEAAAILRVGRNQLYQAVARGELGAVRIGRTIRIPKHALLDLLTPASPARRARDSE